MAAMTTFGARARWAGGGEVDRGGPCLFLMNAKLIPLSSRVMSVVYLLPLRVSPIFYLASYQSTVSIRQRALLGSLRQREADHLFGFASA